MKTTKAVPKQFLCLGDCPILLHTIRKFIKNKKLDKIYVGIHPDWKDLLNELLRQHNITDSRVTVIPGGADRNETLMNIINIINNSYSIGASDVIITHDGVRPFVTADIIEQNIDAVLKYPFCDTAIPSVDTIVVSENGEEIIHTPDRKTMYLLQTPQSFNILCFKNMYENLNKEEKSRLTDACSVFTLSGHKIKIVNGSVHNIKITTAEDYQIATLMWEAGFGDK